VPGIVLLGALSALTVRPAAENQNTTEAARLNGIGVALMNQQLTEKAAAKFAEAHAADPKSAIPMLNEGIALLYLQKLPEAEKALREAATMRRTIRDLVQPGLTEMDEANPRTRSRYAEGADDRSERRGRALFCGIAGHDARRPNGAIVEFQAALKLQPRHASAEFGLARALQRTGERMRRTST